MKLRILPFLLLLASLPAAAATTFTGNSTNATANISQSCTVASANGIAFGNYNSVTTHRTAPLDAQSSISVRCTSGTVGAAMSIMEGTSPGGNCAAGTTARKLRLGATGNYINYDMYQDGGRTVPWGCAASNDYNFADFTSSTVPVALNLYGRVFAGQAGVVGSYSDTVTIYVFF